MTISCTALGPIDAYWQKVARKFEVGKLLPLGIFLDDIIVIVVPYGRDEEISFLLDFLYILPAMLRLIPNHPMMIFLYSPFTICFFKTF